jgi:hypothetical protein
MGRVSIPDLGRFIAGAALLLGFGGLVSASWTSTDDADNGWTDVTNYDLLGGAGWEVGKQIQTGSNSHTYEMVTETNTSGTCTDTAMPPPIDSDVSYTSDLNTITVSWSSSSSTDGVAVFDYTAVAKYPYGTGQSQVNPTWRGDYHGKFRQETKFLTVQVWTSGAWADVSITPNHVVGSKEMFKTDSYDVPEATTWNSIATSVGGVGVPGDPGCSPSVRAMLTTRAEVEASVAKIFFVPCTWVVSKLANGTGHAEWKLKSRLTLTKR